MGGGNNILAARVNTIIGSVFLASFAFGACLIILHAASGETSLAKALSVQFSDQP